MAVSKALRFQVLRRDGHACRYCGRTPPEVKLHVDHVVAVALGGADTPDNLVTACSECNGGKSAIPADAAMVAGRR
jgi:5-methylcytosine-specific restriction endonuclease McrA